MALSTTDPPAMKEGCFTPISEHNEGSDVHVDVDSPTEGNGAGHGFPNTPSHDAVGDRDVYSLCVRVQELSDDLGATVLFKNRLAEELCQAKAELAQANSQLVRARIFQASNSWSREDISYTNYDSSSHTARSNQSKHGTSAEDALKELANTLSEETLTLREKNDVLRQVLQQQQVGLDKIQSLVKSTNDELRLGVCFPEETGIDQVEAGGVGTAPRSASNTTYAMVSRLVVTMKLALREVHADSSRSSPMMKDFSDTPFGARTVPRSFGSRSHSFHRSSGHSTPLNGTMRSLERELEEMGSEVDSAYSCVQSIVAERDALRLELESLRQKKDVGVEANGVEHSSDELVSDAESDSAVNRTSDGESFKDARDNLDDDYHEEDDDDGDAEGASPGAEMRACTLECRSVVAHLEQSLQQRTQQLTSSQETVKILESDFKELRKRVEDFLNVVEKERTEKNEEATGALWRVHELESLVERISVTQKERVVNMSNRNEREAPASVDVKTNTNTKTTALGAVHTTRTTTALSTSTTKTSPRVTNEDQDDVRDKLKGLHEAMSIATNSADQYKETSERLRVELEDLRGTFAREKASWQERERSFQIKMQLYDDRSSAMERERSALEESLRHKVSMLEDLERESATRLQQEVSSLEDNFNSIEALHRQKAAELSQTVERLEKQEGDLVRRLEATSHQLQIVETERDSLLEVKRDRADAEVKLKSLEEVTGQVVAEIMSHTSRVGELFQSPRVASLASSPLRPSTMRSVPIFSPIALAAVPADNKGEHSILTTVRSFIEWTERRYVKLKEEKEAADSDATELSNALKEMKGGYEEGKSQIFQLKTHLEQSESDVSSVTGERDNLLRTVSELQSTVDSLKVEIKVAEAEKADMFSNYSELEEQVALLTSANESATARVEAAEESVLEAERGFGQSQRAMVSLESESDALRVKLSDSRGQLTKTVEELAQVKYELAAVGAEKKEMEMQLDIKTRQLTTFRTNCASMVAHLKGEEAAVATDMEGVDNIEAFLRELNNGISQAFGTTEQLVSEIAMVYGEKHQAEASLRQKEEETERLASDVGTLNARCEELSRVVEEKEEQISALKEEISSLAVTHSALKDSHTKVTASNTSLRADLQHRGDQLDAMTTRCEDLEVLGTSQKQTIGELEQSLAELRQESSEVKGVLEGERDHAVAHGEQLQLAVEELRLQLSQQKAAEALSQAERDSLGASVEEEREKVKQLVESHGMEAAQLRQELEEQQESAEKLRTSVEALERRVGESEERCCEAEVRVREGERQVQALKSVRHSLEAEVKALKAYANGLAHDATATSDLIEKLKAEKVESAEMIAYLQHGGVLSVDGRAMSPSTSDSGSGNGGERSLEDGGGDGKGGRGEGQEDEGSELNDSDCECAPRNKMPSDVDVGAVSTEEVVEGGSGGPEGDGEHEHEHQSAGGPNQVAGAVVSSSSSVSDPLSSLSKTAMEVTVGLNSDRNLSHETSALLRENERYRAQLKVLADMTRRFEIHFVQSKSQWDTLVSKLNGQLKSTTAEKDELSVQLDALARENQLLTDQLAARDNDPSTNMIDDSFASTNITSLEDDRNRMAHLQMKLKLRHVQREKEALLLNLKSSEDTVTALETAVDEAENNLFQKSTEASELENRLCKAEIEVKSLQARHAAAAKALEESRQAMKHSLSSSESEKENLVVDSVKLRAQVKALEVEIQRLRSDSKAQAGQVGELERQLAARFKDIRLKQKQIHKQKAKEHQVHVELERAKQVVRGLVEERECIREHVKELLDERSANAIPEELVKLLSKVREVGNKVEKAQADEGLLLSKAISDNESLSIQLSQSKKQLEGVCAAVKVVAESSANLSSSLEELKSTVTSHMESSVRYLRLMQDQVPDTPCLPARAQDDAISAEVPADPVPSSAAVAHLAVTRPTPLHHIILPSASAAVSETHSVASPEPVMPTLTPTPTPAPHFQPPQPHLAVGKRPTVGGDPSESHSSVGKRPTVGGDPSESHSFVGKRPTVGGDPSESHSFVGAASKFDIFEVSVHHFRDRLSELASDPCSTSGVSPSSISRAKERLELLIEQTYKAQVEAERDLKEIASIRPPVPTSKYLNTRQVPL